MPDVPFLTQIDPRARIKGSRDPLGLQPIWTRLGRQVIRNLTTVTNSLRGFTTLLLGLYVAERMAEEGSPAEDQSLSAFLKFEQLAAYSRVSCAQQNGKVYTENDEDAIRGIRRVLRNLREGNGEVLISAQPDTQILANQKTYGLWGLYSVAARNSGWLESSSPRLTAAARDFIDVHYLPQLDTREDNIFKFLKGDLSYKTRGRHAATCRRLAEMLGPRVTKSERDFYYKHLITGNADGVDDMQERLWKQIRLVDCADPFGYMELLQIIQQCRSRGDNPLAAQLEHIRATESVIAPASFLFGFILAQDGQTIDAIAQNIQATWGAALRHLSPAAFVDALATIRGEIGVEQCDRLAPLAETLADGRYGEAVELLLEQNRAVMQERGGDTWVKRKDNRIDVRLSAEAGRLPPAQQLPTLWMYSYFIDSLKRIGYEIEQGG